MADQQFQMVYGSLFPLGGIATGLDCEGVHEMWLTERGKIVTQCSQQNDLLNTNCGFTLRPRVYRMFAADQGFHEMSLTERGEIMTQCSQQNDLRIPTTNCGFTLRPRVYRMFPADQETERVNIGIQTSRNSPTQGNDNR